MNRWFAAAFVAVIALGAAFRAPKLALRPFHNDEGVNAAKFQGLLETNGYRYDPNEFHGPTLPYFTLPAAWLSGRRNLDHATEAMFRAVPAAFGLALIAVLGLLARDLGWKPILWAALFTAISPAMTYYSRDYIHEILLTFFTALAFFAAWRWTQSQRVGWACLAGVGLGLMAATKETFVFSLAALALALPCARPKFNLTWRDVWRHGALALAIAVVLAVLFFTSFFSNGRGVIDAFLAYLPWLHRAGGATPHLHPWWFYFQRLFFFHEPGGWIWSEALVGALAIIGFIVTRSPLGRIIGYYTIFLTLAYIVLPYKTPWCLLGFYEGMILLAGIGAAALVEAWPAAWGRRLAFAALMLGCANLGWQAWRANFATFKGGLACADPMNPYVYAQTSPDIRHLLNTVEGLARVSPQGYDTVLEVVSPESFWPLPWYLRNFHHVGYWERVPDQPLAPVMIVAQSLDARLDERPGKTHLMAGYFKLRPNVFLELYVNLDLWTRYVAAQPRTPD